MSDLNDKLKELEYFIVKCTNEPGYLLAVQYVKELKRSLVALDKIFIQTKYCIEIANDKTAPKYTVTSVYNQAREALMEICGE